MYLPKLFQYSYLFLLILGILLVSSCSGSKDISPITPDQNLQISEEPIVSDSERDSSRSEVADSILDAIFLGTAIDPQSGKLVEGYAIIHGRNAAKKPDNPGGGGGGGGKPKGSTCFGFLANGAKWKSVEPWIVNPANNSGLSDSFIFGNLTADIAKWEDAANGTLGDGQSIDIIGDGSSTSNTLVADEVQPDGLNEVYFGYIGQGSIGVTIVWGIFGGPPHNRQLVEWDQIYSLSYAWSDSGEAGKMDFENIATHELGHSFGLGDLYTEACISETMYGYADYGETNKRSLEAGDIAGISSLY